MNKTDKIYVAGHNGLVGSALVQVLTDLGYSNLVFRNSKQLDLRDGQAVNAFFEKEKPDYVFLAAAKVGGIMANNTYRGEFIYDNLMIQNNVVHQSYLSGVKKLLFLGSTCIYPKEAEQPIREESLLTDPLEYTNEPYAIAKIAGIKLCESYNLQYGTNFISVMPTNLYGFNDNFDLEKSHVIPAMIRKFHLARMLEKGAWEEIYQDLVERPVSEMRDSFDQDHLTSLLASFGISKEEDGTVRIDLWGSGKPMREFLWSRDMAEACVFVMENVSFQDLTEKVDAKAIRNTHLNIGSGVEISIKDLATNIASIVDFQGKITFDSSKPDGTMRKLTDVSRLASLGWSNKVNLPDGLKSLYDWYCQSVPAIT